MQPAVGKSLFLLLAIPLGSLADKNFEAAGRRWWAHVQYLASDGMQGRGVGSSGFDLAADYVAAQFQRAGLRPGGIDNYFQPVNLIQLTLDESDSSLRLVEGAKTVDVKLGDEAILGVSPDASASVEAPLVFVGYGLKIPEANWDDLAGQPLKGAIAVYLRGGPSSISGNLRSHYASTEERWKAMKAAGVIGTISITSPKNMEVPWARVAANGRLPRMVLADAAMEETPGLEFSATWNSDRAETLFAGTGKSVAEIFAAADQNQALPHFPLKWKVKASTIFKKEAVTSKNVVGIRWGSDPQLSHQFVVFSAHLDHLGVGPIGQEDRIYNGAMDDASGIASLIEIASELDRKKLRMKRSVIFLAVTAEEKGELGSRYYASTPSVEGTYVADINMDMFLPLFPLKYLEVQGLGESTLGDDIRAVCEQAGVEVQADKEPDKNRFIRSDQYSFIKKGVPALAFKFGYLPGTPEEKTFQGWYKERYHSVKDDLSQPVDAAAAAQFDDILAMLGERVANAAQAPSWKQDSFFRRFARSETSSGGF
ncbi:MAG: M28 family metallopeptidase [Bryobacteraceae bacterium]